jgi:uncharacterized phage-associated protein
MASFEFRFRFDKALQAAGLFLRLNGGSMKYLKLLKLLYLADRECLGVEGDTITGDNVRAMPKGPVLTTIYNLILYKDSQSPRWHRYIGKGENYSVFLAENPGTLDLCRFEKEIIERIDQQYKDDNAFDLVELTHTVPEWKKYEERLRAPGSRKGYRISNRDILEGLGKIEMLDRVKENVAAERFHDELHKHQQ